MCVCVCVCGTTAMTLQLENLTSGHLFEETHQFSHSTTQVTHMHKQNHMVL